MGRFYCHCLNVTLSYRGGGVDRSSSIRAEKLLGSTELPENLLNKTLLPVSLDIAGIVSEQSVLVQHYSVGEWNVGHCLNCSTDVYARHKENKERLLVFSNLLTDPSTLKFHPEYSPVFSIVLKDKMADNPQLKEHMSSMTFGQDDKVIKELQAQTEAYLSEEEQKMEQAIREFEAKKREEFRKLRERAHEDRRRLFLSLQLAKEAELVNSLTDATEEDTLTPLVNARREERASLQQPAINAKGSSSSSFNVKTEPIKPPNEISQVSNDDIFDFDEDMLDSTTQRNSIETAASPFPLSSDDDDYDSSSNDGSSSLEDRYRVRTMMPASLPLSMPYLTSKANMELDEVKQSPSNVALSIQKLALSVHDTGMFGDLPKPRVKSSHRH